MWRNWHVRATWYECNARMQPLLTLWPIIKHGTKLQMNAFRLSHRHQHRKKNKLYTAELNITVTSFVRLDFKHPRRTNELSVIFCSAVYNLFFFFLRCRWRCDNRNAFICNFVLCFILVWTLIQSPECVWMILKNYTNGIIAAAAVASLGDVLGQLFGFPWRVVNGRSPRWQREITEVMPVNTNETTAPEVCSFSKLLQTDPPDSKTDWVMAEWCMRR